MDPRPVRFYHYELDYDGVLSFDVDDRVIEAQWWEDDQKWKITVMRYGHFIPEVEGDHIHDETTHVHNA